jgi:TRAP-type C4-dicarboxylate transport system permease small subunit
MGGFWRAVDRLSTFMGHVAAWTFFAIGLMVTWEVFTRKVLNDPTIWVDEVARFAQVWAVYLAAAVVLRQRQLIVVEVLPLEGRPRLARWVESLSLLIIIAFSAVAVWHGGAIVAESVAVGRHTSTMLAVPKWMTESAIPAGFALLLLQALAELVRLWRPATAAGKAPLEAEEP